MPLDAALKKLDIVDDRATKYVADNNNDPVAAAAAGFINLYSNRPGELVKAFGLPDEARREVEQGLIALGIGNIDEMNLRELEAYIEENAEAPNTTQVIAAAQIAKKVPDPRFKSGHRIVLALNGQGAISAGFAQVKMTYGPNGTNMTSNSADLIDQLMGGIDEETLFITIDFPTKSELDGIEQKSAELAQMMSEPAADAGAAAQKIDQIIEQVQKLAEVTNIDAAATLQLATNVVEAQARIESGETPDSSAVQKIVAQISAQITPAADGQTVLNIPHAVIETAQTIIAAMEAKAPEVIVTASVDTPAAVSQASAESAVVAVNTSGAENLTVKQEAASNTPAAQNHTVSEHSAAAVEVAVAEKPQAQASVAEATGGIETKTSEITADKPAARETQKVTQDAATQTTDNSQAQPVTAKADTIAVIAEKATQSVRAEATAAQAETVKMGTAEIKPLTRSFQTPDAKIVPIAAETSFIKATPSAAAVASTATATVSKASPAQTVQTGSVTKAASATPVQTPQQYKPQQATKTQIQPQTAKTVPQPANTNAVRQPQVAHKTPDAKQPTQLQARTIPAAAIAAQVQAIAKQPDMKGNQDAQKILNQVAKTIESGGKLSANQQADLKKIVETMPQGPQRNEMQAIVKAYTDPLPARAAVLVQPDQQQALRQTIVKLDQTLPSNPRTDTFRDALKDIADTGRVTPEQARIVKEWVQENPQYETYIPREVSRALPETVFVHTNTNHNTVISFQKNASDGSGFEVELGCRGNLCKICGKCAIGSQPDATPSSAEIAVQTNVDGFSLKNG